MDEVVRVSQKREVEEEFSFKKFFVPLTTVKAIHWIIFIGIIVYANMVFNPFFGDDYTYIVNAPEAHSFNIATAFGNNIYNNAGQYRPLTLVYFSILYSLFGESTFPFHLFQLILHIGNTILLFILFKKFFGKRLSFILSLLFMVHPMQIESVSYIAATDSPLYFFFGIVALLMVMSQKKSIVNNAIKFFLLLASLLVKETGVLFVPLMLLSNYFYARKEIVRHLVIGILSVVVYIFVRQFVGDVSLANRPMVPIVRASFGERLLTIPQVLFYYVKTLFYPSKLILDQQWVVSKATISQFYAPLFFDITFFGILLFFGGVLYKKRSSKWKVYLFFLTWFLLGLGLHSQIYPLDATVADRWIYFSLAGLLGVLGVISQLIFSVASKSQKKILLMIALFIVLLLSGRTILRNSDWQNPELLYRQALSVNDNYLGEEDYSITLLRDGKFNEAIDAARKSVAEFPNDLNLYNLGYIYEISGKYQLAEKAYVGAYDAKNYIPWQHKHYEAVYLRASNLLLYFKDPKSAKKILDSGLKDYPNDPELLIRLAVSDYELGDKNDALSLSRQAVQLSPNNAVINTIYQKILSNMPITIQL